MANRWTMRSDWRWAGVLLIASVLACAPGKGHPPRLEDAKALQKVVADVDKVNKLLDEFAQGPGKQHQKDETISEDQRKKLLSLWAPYLDHTRALQSYQLKFLTGWKQAGSPELQTQALAAGMVALAAQVNTNLKFLRAVGRRDQMRTILNDPSAEYGIGASEFDRMLVRMGKPQTMFTLQLGGEALQRRMTNIRGDKKKENVAFTEVGDKSLALVKEAQAAYDKQAIMVAMQAMATVASNQFNDLSGALITDIAEWLGDTRLRSRADSLISAAQVDWLATQCLPGDVFVERRNWYLSNLGLPGFWPHAELYIGTADDMAKLFDSDADVIKAYGTGGLTGYLKQNLPDRWKEYTANAADGTPHRILEAVSEGVQFSSLLESAKADYLGAIRPRLTKLERARAIAKAFEQLGKPYDFEFDFLTQSTLVCSEVVYVAYLPEKGLTTGLNLPLEDVMGRQALPPTNLIQIFDTQFGTPQQQFDFVAFLDGREATKNAVVATEAALRASWKRPKWDTAQQ